MTVVVLEKQIANLGDLKKAIKKAQVVYVWVNWQGDDGDYVQIHKSTFLRGICADAPFEESGHGGRPDWTPVRARAMESGEVYVG